MAKIDGKGLVTVNEDVVLKEIGKTYHVCPSYNGGRDWPYGAYDPRSNVMFVQMMNICIDSTARADRGPLPEFVYNTTNVGKFSARQGQCGPHRRDLGRDRPHGVELGDARLDLCADPGDGRRTGVQRLHRSVSARARCR